MEELLRRVDAIEEQLQHLDTNAEASVDAAPPVANVGDPDQDKVKALTQTTFSGVMDADKTHDDKAQRILSTMAFLTAAAAALFNRANPPNIAIGIYFATLPANVLAFAGYMLLVSVGAVLYLASLGGGALNLPSRFRDEDKSPNSLLFFMRIGRLTPREWKEQWEKPYAELEAEVTRNYIGESYLIAQTVRAKVRWLAFGSTLFKLAIVALLFVASSVLASDAQQFWVYGLLGSFLFFCSTVIEVWLRPNQDWDGFAHALILLAVASVLSLVKAVLFPTAAISHVIIVSTVWVVLLAGALEIWSRWKDSLHEGDSREAVALLEQALALARGLGDKWLLAGVLGNLGHTSRVIGDAPRAARYIEEQLALARELGDLGMLCGVLHTLGYMTMEQGDYEQAQALCEQSLALARQIGEKEHAAWALRNLGRIAWLTGDRARAMALAAESIALSQEIHVRGCIAISLADLAEELGAEQPYVAVRLLGAADALLAGIRSVVDAGDAARFERSVAELRERVGAERFATAWEEGQSMTLGQVVEQARAAGQAR